MAAKSTPLAFVCTLAIAAALVGCAQNNAGTTGSIVSSFDPGSTASRFRSSGARETTLADFCRHPPPARSPEGAEAIKASCQRIVLDKVGDAALFNSSLVWGGMTGVLLATAIEPGRDITAGISLSGLGMGLVGGLMLTRYFDISRTPPLFLHQGGSSSAVELEATTGYDGEIRHLLGCLAHGRVPAVTLEDATMTHALLDAERQSLQTRDPSGARRLSAAP